MKDEEIRKINLRRTILNLFKRYNSTLKNFNFVNTMLLMNLFINTWLSSQLISAYVINNYLI